MTVRHWIALLLLLAPLASRAALPALPSDFRAALTALPTDCESLVATLQPFTIPKLATKLQPAPFDDFLKTGLAVAYDITEMQRPELRALEGKEIRWAIIGKRRQDVLTNPGGRTIALGVHPFEQVAIAKFREPVPASFIDSLQPERADAFGGIPAYRSVTGAVTVLLPAPDLLVTITTLTADRRMVDDVVSRLAARPADHLFESAAASFALVEYESSVWGIRKTTNARGRHQDANGRDWVLFAYDRTSPQRAVFRSILNEAAQPVGNNPWLQYKDTEKTMKDLGLTVRTRNRGAYIDTTLECLPEFFDRCLQLPFLLEGLGVMVWI